MLAPLGRARVLLHQPALLRVEQLLGREIDPEFGVFRQIAGGGVVHATVSVGIASFVGLTRLQLWTRGGGRQFRRFGASDSGWNFLHDRGHDGGGGRRDRQRLGSQQLACLRLGTTTLLVRWDSVLIPGGLLIRGHHQAIGNARRAPPVHVRDRVGNVLQLFFAPYVIQQIAL